MEGDEGDFGVGFDDNLGMGLGGAMQRASGDDVAALVQASVITPGDAAAVSIDETTVGMVTAMSSAFSAYAGMLQGSAVGRGPNFTAEMMAITLGVAIPRATQTVLTYVDLNKVSNKAVDDAVLMGLALAFRGALLGSSLNAFGLASSLAPGQAGLHYAGVIAMNNPFVALVGMPGGPSPEGPSTANGGIVAGENGQPGSVTAGVAGIGNPAGGNIGDPSPATGQTDAW